MEPTTPNRVNRGKQPLNSSPIGLTESVGSSRYNPDDDTKFVQIKYSCGSYICDGPEISNSRLRRFSKRARREVQGGTTWIVKCQHYEQDILFDKIFAWFTGLPHRNARSDFIHRGYHPAIDRDDEWLPQLSWKHLLLLNHSLDYLHLRQPLDNKKVRANIWQKLTLDELDNDPLTAEDMHLAFHLLQFKSKWVHEATVDSDVMISPRVAQQGQIRMASSSSLTSGISTSSSLNDELLDVFEGWETLNSALIRNMIRKVATWLENGGGDEPYEAYVQKLRDTAQAGDHHAEEDNTLLITALGIAYDDRKKRREQRGEMRSVSGGSVDRAWREAAGEM